MQLVKTAQGIRRSASAGGPSTPGRKPPVPPEPNITPSAKKKLWFTPEVGTAELAKELPFSEEPSLLPSNVTHERRRPLWPKRKAKLLPKKPWKTP